MVGRPMYIYEPPNTTEDSLTRVQNGTTFVFICFTIIHHLLRVVAPEPIGVREDNMRCESLIMIYSSPALKPP